MRNILIATAALALAGPAAAQAPIFTPEMDDDIQRSIPHPGEVAEMGVVLDQVVGAVLDVPIGPIVQAVDPYGRGRYRRDDTLRDMAESSDPYFEDRLRDDIYGVTAGMGAMAGAVAAMAPALRQTLAVLERSVSDAVRESRARRYGRDYRDDRR